MTKREFFENELKMKPSEIGTAVPFNPNGETEVTEEWLISFIKNLLAERSKWHTGTPTENGYYLCKVFYDKDTPNDMRILEWVGSLDCFCIPYSEFRAYHYYVGENNGEDVEVVYEWQKLDMRFRMETKWIEPYKEKQDGHTD